MLRVNDLTVDMTELSKPVYNDLSSPRGAEANSTMLNSKGETVTCTMRFSSPRGAEGLSTLCTSVRTAVIMNRL